MQVTLSHVHNIRKVPAVIVGFLFLVYQLQGRSSNVHTEWRDIALVIISLAFDWWRADEQLPFLGDLLRPKVSSSIGVTISLCLLFSKLVGLSANSTIISQLTITLCSVFLLQHRTWSTICALPASLFFINAVTWQDTLHAILPTVMLFWLLWRLPRTFSVGEGIICSMLMFHATFYSTSFLTASASSQLTKVAAVSVLSTSVLLGLLSLTTRRVSPIVFFSLLMLPAGSLLYRFVQWKRLLRDVIVLPRISISIRWTGLLLCIITLTSLFVHFLHSSTPFQRQLSRKFYHLMAVIMFIPPLIHDVDWLRFSFVMAACVFILVETFRLFCCGIDSRLAWGMETFRNGLDTGDAVLSHLWLLLGCAIPVFAVGNIWEISVAASGIVSLGILDSAAAVFGMGFGKTQWPGSEKTIVGSIAGMLAYVFAQYVVFSLQSFRDQSVPIVPWFIQGLICAAWEATSDQNDNITLPLVAYISCTIIPAIA